ncbi:MAG: helix-turn-helix transcriptional regulator [Ruminococcus sp.]|nr:helix-turn-helix transcriptional regulator [Ruminococcus sp.]
MSIHEKIRIYIDKNGLNQSSIAKKAGIPAAAFTEILNGKRTLYSDDLRAICYALKVKPELFM